MTPRATHGGKLRVGLLGAGMITTSSYGFLPGLAKMKDRASVVAITSRTRDLAETVARDWDIPAVYDDLDAMLARADLDVVVNATPIPAHYETSMKVLAGGLHLVTDKPLAQTIAEADDLITLAAAHGSLIVSAPAEMLTDDWAEARRLVRAGAIGKVAFARVQSSHAGAAAMGWPVDPSPFYRKGQGSLLDLGVYGLDRITSILGPAMRVSAFSGLAAPTRVVEGGPFHGKTIESEVDDNVLLILDFGNATFAVVDCCYTVAATRSAPMEIFGLDGSLVIQRPDATVLPGQLALELFNKHAGPGLSGWVSPRTIGFPRPNRAQILQRAALVDHLADCLETGAPPAAGPDRARHVLEITLAAGTAARDSRVVELTTTFATDY